MSKGERKHCHRSAARIRDRSKAKKNKLMENLKKAVGRSECRTARGNNVLNEQMNKKS